MKQYKIFYSNCIGNVFKEPIIITAESTEDAIILCEDRYPDITIRVIEESECSNSAPLLPFPEDENPPLFI